MTDSNYRHYVLIVDRSGSMHNIKEDAQGGIRQYIKEQAALPGKATLSFYQFDHEHETVHDFSPLPAAAGYVLQPRGMTRLFDACGFAVTEVGERLAAMPEHERPKKVMVLIVTDGKNNDSREWTKGRVKELLTTQQENYKWQVSYVGPDVNAFEESAALGISPDTTLAYDSDSGQSTNAAWRSMSKSSTRYSAGGSAGYTQEERDATRRSGK